MIKTQFDIKNLEKVFEESRNYESEVLNFDSKECYIFFSSNSLYAPNTDDVFNDTIIKRNRYEWKRNVPSNAGKVIFVRDIKKQWYLDGINSEINSINKLKSLLIKETQGYSVTCVGSSSGGYAAVLFGTLLEANKVISFSGQFSLNFILEDPVSLQKNPLIKIYSDNTKYTIYYSLTNLIKESGIKIYYFYPSKCNQDQEQYKQVSFLRNLQCFGFTSRIHGKTCYLVNLKKLVSFSHQEMEILHRRFNSKLIHPFYFSLYVSGIKETLRFLFIARNKIYLKKFQALLHSTLKNTQLKLVKQTQVGKDT